MREAVEPLMTLRKSGQSVESVDTRNPVVDPESSAAKLPHEHDESAGMTGGIPSVPVQQAHRDVTRGLVDTDRGPVADATYRKLKKDA